MNVLHDEEELAVGRDHIERRRDVGVANARRDARFVQEHRDELVLAREVRVEALDRHEAREAPGAERAPEVHRRHATRRDLVVDRVAAIDDVRTG